MNSGAHMGGGRTDVRSPVANFRPFAPPPVKFMTAHKLRYSDSDFRLIISDYSDFSSDILKEYVKKKPRVLEFNIEGRILNCCAQLLSF